MRLIDADELIRIWNGCELTGSIAPIVNARPTVDAEPVRHGKWARENHYGMWKCSECGCRVRRANPLKGNIWNYYYCPNCGAKMDAERKEE